MKPLFSQKVKFGNDTVLIENYGKLVKKTRKCCKHYEHLLCKCAFWDG